MPAKKQSLKFNALSRNALIVIGLAMTASLMPEEAAAFKTNASLKSREDKSEGSASPQSNLAVCEGMTQLQRQGGLSAAKLQIEVDPRLIHSEFGIPYPESILINVENAINDCETALKTVLENPEFPNLDVMKRPLRVALVATPRNARPGSRSYGAYIPSENLIEISYDPKYTLADYLPTIRNELYSHQVIAINLQRATQSTTHEWTLLVCPFLGADGKIDNKAYTRFDEAISKTIKKINYFLQELPKSKNPEKDEKFAGVINASKNFVSPIAYETSKNPQSVKILKIPTKSTHPADQKFDDLEIIQYGKKVGNNYIFTYTPENPSDKEKALGLLSYLRRSIYAINDPAGESFYAKQEKHVKLAELASAFGMLSPEQQEVICPEFRAYMCEYFAKQKQENIPSYYEPAKDKTSSPHSKKASHATLFKEATQAPEQAHHQHAKQQPTTQKKHRGR